MTQDSFHNEDAGVAARKGNGSAALSRREFLADVGIGAAVLALGSLGAAVLRFLQPVVTTPPPGPVAIGAAKDYPVGSYTYAENARAYVARDAAGLYAVIAVCTHLGCTPRVEADQLVCPCHGSRFMRDGTLVNGPAARPLDRAWIGVGADGQLIVDRGRIVGPDFRLHV